MSVKKIFKILSVAFFLVVAIIVAGVAILNSTDLTPFKDKIARQISEQTGRAVSINGDLKLDISLQPKIQVGGLRLENAKWSKNPDMLRVENFSVEADLWPLLSGTIRINRLNLDGVSLWLEQGADNRKNWVFKNRSDTAPSASPDSGANAPLGLPEIGDVGLSNIRVVYSAPDSTDRQLFIDNLSLRSKSPSSPVTIVLNGKISDQNIEMRGQVPNLSAWQTGERQTVQFSMDALGISVKTNGFAGLGNGEVNIDQELKLNIKSLSQTFENIKQLSPELKEIQIPEMSDIVLKARLRASPENLTAENIKMIFSGNDLSGNFSVNLFDGVTKVRAALASKKIDLTPFIPRSPKQQPGATAKDRLFSDQPLEIPALNGLDIELRYKPEWIIVDGLNIRNGDLGLRISGNTVTFNPVQATVADGTLQGKIILDTSAQGLKINSDVELENLSSARLLTELGQKVTVDGAINGIVQLTGNGNSVRTIMASLSGRTRVFTENSKLDIKGLGIFSSDVLGVIPGFSSGDGQLLRCGVVDFDVKKGKSSVRSMVFVTEPIVAVGEGLLDLADEQIKLRMTPKVRNTSLASVALVPVNVTGTFLQPDYSLDKAGLVGNAAGTALRGIGAFATFGASLLVENQINQSIDQTDYCKPALAGKKVTLMKTESKPATETTKTPPRQTQPTGGNPAGDLVKGLKSLFGN